LSQMCKYLDQCVESTDRCPFLRRGKSPNPCGFFSILSRIEEYGSSYTDSDRRLVKEFVEILRSRWLEGVEGGSRALGRITGTVFEEWVYGKLSEELRGVCSLRRGKKVYLDLGGSKVEWAADIYIECGGRVTAVEVKMILDKQHSLMAKALLDFTDIGWIFVSFHPPDGKTEKILQHIQSTYIGRFMYSSLSKNPYRAIKSIAEFCRER